MKPVLALTFVLALMTSAALVTAQERVDGSAAPIARAVTREAARLPAGQQTDTGNGNWSRVRALPVGARITVTIKGAQPAKRDFVAAGNDQLTVLSPSPDVPGDVVSRLLEMASTYPAVLAALQGLTVVTQPSQALGQQDLRVGPDGVFLGNRKVADLGQIVETIARADVAEIFRPGSTRRSVGWAAAGAAARLQSKRGDVQR